MALRFRVALRLERVRLAASDLSTEALELAAENLAEHRVGGLVTLACTDLLDGAGDLLPAPDVVVANLPYVASDEVRAAGGSPALRAGRLAGRRLGWPGPHPQAAARRPGRRTARRDALLEVGAGQADAVRGLAPPGSIVETRTDMAAIERVVRIGLPSAAGA